MVTRELVGKVVCSSYGTHQKVISYSWILAITRAYSSLKSTSSTIAFYRHANFFRARQVTRCGRAQVVGRSLIGRKALQVSRGSVASVSRRSGRGCDSGTRVYADRLTNGVRGSRARKSVVVRSQVTLITWPIKHYLFPRMSVAHQHRCKR